MSDSARITAVGVNNLSKSDSRLAATSAVSSAQSSAVAPLVVYPFPSSGSTVVGSVGFIDAEQIGYFWSVSRGDHVAETFAGPGRVRKVILQLDVPNNVLANAAEVDWTVSINGTDVGGFKVVTGQVGPFTVKYIFPRITGGSYTVDMRVTNEVASGDGSHTLRYAGTGPHTVTLKRR